MVHLGYCNDFLMVGWKVSGMSGKRWGWRGSQGQTRWAKEFWLYYQIVGIHWKTRLELVVEESQICVILIGWGLIWTKINPKAGWSSRGAFSDAGRCCWELNQGSISRLRRKSLSSWTVTEEKWPTTVGSLKLLGEGKGGMLDAPSSLPGVGGVIHHEGRFGNTGGSVGLGMKDIKRLFVLSSRQLRGNKHPVQLSIWATVFWELWAKVEGVEKLFLNNLWSSGNLEITQGWVWGETEAVTLGEW